LIADAAKAIISWEVGLPNFVVFNAPDHTGVAPAVPWTMAVAIRYQSLMLVCQCGKVARSVADVGLTSSHQLLVHWRCAQCRRHMYMVKPLSECWRECPPEPNQSREHAERVEAADRRFLRNLKIKYPDE